jgi:preprotein translocase subunit SecG
MSVDGGEPARAVKHPPPYRAGRVERRRSRRYTRKVARGSGRLTLVVAKEILVSPIVYVLVVLDVICAIGLIIFVLLHSGKGTGLSSMFGGMSSAASGTSIIEKNLDRITVGLAVGWAVLSVLLMMFYRP